MAAGTRWLAFLVAAAAAWREAQAAASGADGVCDLTLSHEARLQQKLFSCYDPRVRPVSGLEAVEVKMGVALSSLLSVDLVTGVAVVNIMLRAKWYDPRLDWNSSEYGGLLETFVEHGDVWMPDLLAYNHIERFDKDIRTENTRISLYPDGGGLFWSRPGVIRLSLNVDASQFPFDTQEVPLDFASWSYSGFMQNLDVMPYTILDGDNPSGSRLVSTGEVDLSTFAGNAEFEVVTSPAKREIRYYACCPSEPWPFVTFNLKAVRMSRYYVTNIILPVMTTTGVSFLSFAAHHGCGERMGLCVSCLLVIVAFMIVSGDLIPVTDQRTTIGTYYTGCFLFCLWSLFMTAVSHVFQSQTEGDLDGDGHMGSEYFRHVLGLSPKTSLWISYRIDFYCFLLTPMVFGCFNAVVLRPWEDLPGHLLAALLTAGGFLLAYGSFVMAILLQRRWRGLSTDGVFFQILGLDRRAPSVSDAGQRS